LGVDIVIDLRLFRWFFEVQR